MTGLSRCGDDVVNTVFIMAIMGRRKGDKIGVSVMSRMCVTAHSPTGDGNSRPSGPKPSSGDLVQPSCSSAASGPPFTSNADLPHSWLTENEKAMSFFLVESMFLDSPSDHFHNRHIAQSHHDGFRVE
jgi:hypothetical protein